MREKLGEKSWGGMCRGKEMPQTEGRAEKAFSNYSCSIAQLIHIIHISTSQPLIRLSKISKSCPKLRLKLK